VENRPSAPILLVDDEPANLLAMEAVLQGLGEPLVCAASGEEAMRQLRDRDFAAVLLDLHMPGMDGFDTARLIRAQKRSRETPILFMTADASDLSAREAYSLGAVDFLVKPFRTAPLIAKLGFFIELHRSRQELRQAERQAVQDRVFLSAVLEAIEDAIVACDTGGRLTLLNRAAREFLGLPGTGLPKDPWPNRHNCFRPDGTPMTEDELPLRRALRGDHVDQVEVVIGREGDPPRPVLASGQALRDENGEMRGAVVSLHDISAWRAAESERERAAAEQIRREEAEAAAALLREGRERLRESEQRVRLATEAAGLGIWVIDIASKHVTWENERLHEIFGLPAGAPAFSIDDFMSRFVHPEDAPRFSDSLRATLANEGRMRVEGRIRRANDGALRWIETTGVLQMDDDGKPVRVLGTVADITDRKRAEEDLRESDRRKTEFLATLAHELRNPLAPISNGLHLLRRAPDETSRGKVREMMERQLRHMVHLVDDLLDIARITSNKVELRLERVDVGAVLASAVETSMPLVSAGGHTLDVRGPAQPLYVDADATRLAQIVSNLLNNAAKYTPHGGRIELSASEEDGEAVVRVKDTGMGIPVDELPQVFEMFTQVGRNLHRAQGGLGIGLALVKRLVELHGGRVDASSDGIGSGSTFIVRLPLESAAVSPAPGVAADGPAAGSPSPFRVLVVDDNVDAAESLAALLEMQGHQVRIAHDGETALRVAAEFLPRVVFLDIGMPGKNGYQVAREMRERASMRHAILVALSGWGAQEDRARSRSAGFDHHLTKPAGLASVEALLARIASDEEQHESAH
jgi:PAS domain S-box-containing protein